MASVLVRRNGALRLYNKGAAEMVLTRCTAMINAAGETVPMTEVRRDRAKQVPVVLLNAACCIARLAMGCT